MCMAKRCFFPMVVHVLGELELEELCDLCIHSCGVFHKWVESLW